MKRYRLYAFPVREEYIELAQKERFARICADYILIYAAKTQRGGVQVTKRDLHLLTEADESWLRDCNLILLVEQGRRQRGATLADVARRLDALEQVLKDGAGTAGENGQARFVSTTQDVCAVDVGTLTAER